MGIEALSNIYNKSNTENVSKALNNIKTYFGNQLFESLLKNILAQNNAGIERDLRDKVVDKSYQYMSPEDNARNKMLSDFRDTLFFANRYNSPEAECEDCGKIASDVLSRPNIGRKLCTACYEKLVPHTKVSPSIARAVLGAYGEPSKNDEYELPDFLKFNPNDEDTDILV